MSRALDIGLVLVLAGGLALGGAPAAFAEPPAPLKPAPAPPVPRDGHRGLVLGGAPAALAAPPAPL